MLKKTIKNQRGLTLIELLAVVVILGIIAAIAVPAIGNVIERSKVEAIKADAIQVLNAADLYMSTVNPADTTTLDQDDLNGDYVESAIFETYTVNVTERPYTISATGTDGNVEVTFEDASKEDINDSEPGQKTIPE